MDFNKLTKKQSGFFILIVYIFSYTVGYLGLHFLVLNSIYSFIISLLIVDIVMTLIIYIAGLVTKNASFYDPYWSVTPIFLLFMCLLFNASFSSISINSILITLVILIWGVRLTYNWWKNWKGFDIQDWRYDMLKGKTKKLYPLINLLGIHLFPTIIVFVQFVNVNEITKKNSLDLVFIMGIIIALMAVLIQHFSDVQMYRFRVQNKGKTKSINTGLWRYSRHPNYMGEIMFWTGIYISYFSYDKTINYYVIFPILMMLMFRFISIPMMEKKLSKREGYLEYKNHVSALIPLPNQHFKKRS